jgi:hypothetical protein
MSLGVIILIILVIVLLGGSGWGPVLRDRLLWRRGTRSCDRYYFDLSVAGKALEGCLAIQHVPPCWQGRVSMRSRVQARNFGR